MAKNNMKDLLKYSDKDINRLFSDGNPSVLGRAANIAANLKGRNQKRFISEDSEGLELPEEKGVEQAMDDDFAEDERMAKQIEEAVDLIQELHTLEMQLYHTTVAYMPEIFEIAIDHVQDVVSDGDGESGEPAENGAVLNLLKFINEKYLSKEGNFDGE